MMNICSNSIQFYRPLLYLPCESVGTIVVLHLHGAVLILLAGEVTPYRNDTDREMPFRQVSIGRCR